ncbi:response regulator transcription factor [Streptococcus thoraltensis]|uniref:response regulator transcription factor n=1 Tax=Streptococcus thoraltensis TaxID=55085 RepID=UPI00037BFBE2|nr:response regulator transcription factor [Streptococcus thoraltensis]MDY4761689.1 response regulator transcription factor [Streptococcus thoraltensis]
MTHSILLVDDEPDIIDINKRYLNQAGFEVLTANNGLEALEIFQKHPVDLIISDIMMPQMDGYDFISEVLSIKEEQAFLFITAKTAEPDKIYSLSLGADDFICKPFSPRELVLRVTNILKRLYGRQQAQEELLIGDLVINHQTRAVSVNGHSLELTNKAFDILWLLAHQKNRVFSKSELYESVWDETFIEDTNTLNVHIHALRNDLARHSTPQTPSIKTVWGLGYKLEVAP